mmetsp:Transcript_14016/g.47319  ORF Transcript_14016/g.47319 Transcript_14016/m.47319 type:complete len:336 (+) Transcript_14016:336-1343(+)
MTASASGSTLAVASSMTITGARRSSARAMHKSCRCPTLMLPPSSATSAWSPRSSRDTYSRSRTRPRASHSSASGCSNRGSRFERIEPLKRVGLCGTMASAPRSSSSPRAWVSTPSMRMLPPQGSTTRNSAAVRELLPAPVRPTMPTRSPGRASKHTPRSTTLLVGEYLSITSRNTTWPLDGHPRGAGLPSTTAGASCGTCVYSSMRSTAFIIISSSAWVRSIHVKASLNCMAKSSASAPSSALTPLRSNTRSAATEPITTAPSVCMRKPSQRLATHRLKWALPVASRRPQNSLKKRPCSSKARTMGSPFTVSPSMAYTGDLLTLCARLSSREEAW